MKSILTTLKTFNKIIYKFIFNCMLNLVKLLNLTIINFIINQIETKNILNFIIITIKYYYNHFHQFLFLKVKNYILL